MASRPVPAGSVTVGLDFGTSGARVMAVDSADAIVGDARVPWPSDASSDWPAAWAAALWDLLTALPASVRSSCGAIAVDGTSATCLLVDAVTGAPLTRALLYNHACPAALPAVQALAPAGHTGVASTSSLSKLMTWHQAGQVAQGAVLEHQADYVAALLHGVRGCSDWNNALKLGFDPGTRAWPAWLTASPVGGALPRRVVRPGASVGQLTPDAARRLGMPTGVRVAAGTTDSIAAFLAASAGQGGLQEGDAVTSLGSTLAVKLLSSSRVADDAAFGMYSHRLGEHLWLAGGASNTGGAVLRSLFPSDDVVRQLSERIDAEQASPLDYYPLVTRGERFPVNDPALEPQLSPRPADDAAFLHGVLESMARIEARGYQLLADRGAPPLRRVLTAGGGAANKQWTAIRQRVLGVPVSAAPQGEAAFGAALLARQALAEAA
jgi:sugar (pentulose or hexulose) kinase